MTPPRLSVFCIPISPEFSNDPFLLTDMREAVGRIGAAIDAHDCIGIHGDDDVDGITATVILRRVIELVGGQVVHFVPDRLKDGYGLQPETIGRLRDLGARVIVSVDCGIRAVEAADRARELGIDLIITDHHEPGGELPRAVAVINPKRAELRIPTRTWRAPVSR